MAAEAADAEDLLVTAFARGFAGAAIEVAVWNPAALEQLQPGRVDDVAAVFHALRM